jgi:hypothetical protein
LTSIRNSTYDKDKHAKKSNAIDTKQTHLNVLKRVEKVTENLRLQIQCNSKKAVEEPRRACRLRTVRCGGTRV